MWERSDLRSAYRWDELGRKRHWQGALCVLSETRHVFHIAISACIRSQPTIEGQQQCLARLRVAPRPSYNKRSWSPDCTLCKVCDSLCFLATFGVLGAVLLKRPRIQNVFRSPLGGSGGVRTSNYRLMRCPSCPILQAANGVGEIRAVVTWIPFECVGIDYNGGDVETDKSFNIDVKSKHNRALQANTVG